MSQKQNRSPAAEGSTTAAGLTTRTEGRLSEPITSYCRTILRWAVEEGGYLRSADRLTLDTFDRLVEHGLGTVVKQAGVTEFRINDSGRARVAEYLRGRDA